MILFPLWGWILLKCIYTLVLLYCSCVIFHIVSISTTFQHLFVVHVCLIVGACKLYWLLPFLYARLQTGRIMVWWCPSVRPSGSPSVHPSVRPSQFSAIFSYMLWDIELKFCVSLYFHARKIKFECHQFPSIFAGVMPLLNFTLLLICSFPHISLTCFDILSWNFACDFVLLYYRSSLSVVNLRQFLLELCPFWNLE